MKISELIHALEVWAPPALQEDYDNSGLIIGNAYNEVSKALVCLDVTDEVLEEAISEKCGLVIAHHPIIFSGIKKITGRTYTEKLVIKAIKNDIAIYAIHTNLDNVPNGVNKKIAHILDLKNLKILQPKSGALSKLVTYVPHQKAEDGTSYVEKVKDALWLAGAGHIGMYDECSFSSVGTGTFRAGKGTNPFIGEVGKRENAEEIKIEVILPEYKQKDVIAALKQAHPYEEVAYDIFPMLNKNEAIGAGMIGETESPLGEKEFLLLVKEKLKAGCVKHTSLSGKKINKVAVCGGSGSFLLKDAIAAGADIFITSDFKYHQFFDAQGRIIIADVGHYESEQYTIELIHDKLREIFPNFALLKTKHNTNPVTYL